MSNLTNRSKLFLKKKKAQYGDFIRDSVSYIDQDVFQQKPMYSQQKEESSLIDSLPLISSVGQIVGGIAGIFEGNKKRRIQQIFDNASQEDLKQRREQSRANNFYLTPYATTRTDNLTAKRGMKVPIYQNGGQMDLFMDFYNQQEQASKDLLNQLKNTYKDKNERLLNDAGQTKNNAFNNILGGAMGVATSLFQGGGLLPESSQVQILPREFSTSTISGNLKSQEFKFSPDSNVNRGVPVIPNAQAAAVTVAAQTPDYLTDFRFLGKGSNKIKSKPRYRMKQEGGEIDTESLYSEDFQSPNQDQGFSEQEIQNFLSSTVPGEEMQKNSNLLSWLFEEEPLDTYTTNDIYHSTYGQDTSVNIPKGDIATTHSNPGNIKYGKFAQKYGAQPGRAATDGGIFAVFPSVEAGLQAQKDLLTSGSYANLTVGDAMKRWSNSGYGADLYPQIANKKMKDLTSQELNELILRQTKRESPTIYKKIYGNTK